MSSGFEFGINGSVLSCPFSHTCNLPKSQSICGFPEYKICPDFEKKMLNFKSSLKIIH
ncbi:MAG: hypothetical protein ACFFKA_05460 [Candidatus Thorarchaeota archaeon]